MFVFRARLIVFRFVLLAVMFFSTLSVSRAANLRPALTLHSYMSGFGWPPPVVMTTSMVGQAKDVFQKVNYQRRIKSLSVLGWDEDIAEMARAYAKQMSKDKFFSHYDNEKRSLIDRADEFEITNWSRIGENLFKSEGVSDPASVSIEKWLKSKSHRKNMLDPGWTHTGIGVFTGKDGVTFIVQVFAKRESKRVAADTSRIRRVEIEPFMQS